MKVSIVTASYNSGKTIEDTIKSVLAQTYSDIEYIIVDGGSADNTVDIIKQYEPVFGNRLVWRSERDKGIYDGMNKGIALATGDVVGILNSDDYFTADNIIEKVVEAMSDATVDAVFGDVHYIHSDRPDKCVRYYSSAMFKPFWLRFGFMPAHPSLYVRRSVYQRIGLYKMTYKIGSDFEMSVRMFKKHRIRYKYLPIDFVTMRMGGASTRGLGAKWQLLLEDTRACKENGLYTNPFIICLKYFYKLTEFVPLKFK